jgi:hypothetical protein
MPGEAASVGAVDDVVIDGMAGHIHSLAEGMDFTKQAGNGPFFPAPVAVSILAPGRRYGEHGAVE